MKNQQVVTLRNFPPEIKEWVVENGTRLFARRNKSELLAGERLAQLFPRVEQQVYFRIHGRSYFLDFYIPEKKLAIEIDGAYHKTRRETDKRRDMDFNKIGIRTIRISASSVLAGDFQKELESAFSTSVKTKKHRNRAEARERMIRQAMKRVKQHSSMCHKASWV